MKELYRTSDTPFAAVLLALGYPQVDMGINGNNGRVWFGFEIDLDLAKDFEEEWLGDTDMHVVGNLANINLMFKLRQNFVRLAKGGKNNRRFTNEVWDRLATGNPKDPE